MRKVPLNCSEWIKDARFEKNVLILYEKSAALKGGAVHQVTVGVLILYEKSAAEIKMTALSICTLLF